MTHTAGQMSHHDQQSGLRQKVAGAFGKLSPRARKAVLHALGKYAPWEEGFDLTPPQPGPGDITGPPDFVGIGAQKAGTTWWYEAICAHPGVHRAPHVHKERHYFDRYALRPFGQNDCERYWGWFPRPSGLVTGEWTPDYLDMPWAPALLSLAAPKAKLLVVLRDPVDRLRSGFAHVRHDHGHVTLRDQQEAVDRGLYHAALSRWLRYFPPQQMLVLQYERCLLDPADQIARTYAFLDLSAYTPEVLRSRVNPSSNLPHFDDEVRKRLVELYAPDVHLLCKLLPEIDLRLWPNFD